MKFSVLMSVYFKESASNLNRCFQSLYMQTLPANEVVLVVDGNLTHELYNCIDDWKKKLPLLIVQLECNVGLGNALNIGLSSCSHELIARMDTDDICHKDRFSKQVELFLNTPQLSICGGYISEFYDHPDHIVSIRKVPCEHHEIAAKCIWYNPFNHMSVMYRKADIEEIGGYQHFPWMEDWYLWLRLVSKNYKTANLGEVLVNAQTGIGMIERRTGWTYVKSEWEISKKKVQLGLARWPLVFFIFISRSIPRILPKKIAMALYLRARKILT
ncbi:hypothetical protein XV92_08810 [Vibrio metoecus]|uniref:Glycosyltransferase 2-like domain-containing protein n=1 Tax=Vibrio metoecus TaxID=1481663 RepID=A0A0Q0PXU7_VIBMT|nr:hypothetical protein XV92_08810 [Vibrio metoecus]